MGFEAAAKEEHDLVRRAIREGHLVPGQDGKPISGPGVQRGRNTLEAMLSLESQEATGGPDL